MNFIESWYFIQQHPLFKFEGEHETFPYRLDIQPVLVNPKTMSIDRKDSKNTKLQIWLECGPYEDSEPTHDIDLDCGADTFEEAIIELARLIKNKYGDYSVA